MYFPSKSEDASCSVRGVVGHNGVTVVVNQREGPKREQKKRGEKRDKGSKGSKSLLEHTRQQRQKANAHAAWMTARCREPTLLISREEERLSCLSIQRAHLGHVVDKDQNP
jgi:hypothetical protein